MISKSAGGLDQYSEVVCLSGGRSTEFIVNWAEAAHNYGAVETRQMYTPYIKQSGMHILFIRAVNAE